MTNIITKRHNELQVERTGRAAGQLSRFHHKGPVASIFAEYKPNELSRVGCNVGGLLQA